jgi:hypothetical protein
LPSTKEVDAGMCSSAFAFKVHPLGVQTVVFPRAGTTPSGTLLLRQAEDSFPHLDAVGGVSRLSCNCPIRYPFSQGPHIDSSV